MILIDFGIEFEYKVTMTTFCDFAEEVENNILK